MKIYQKIIEAKREIGKVAKNAKNPHFKNTYADLNALIEAVEPILLEKGLTLLQPIIENKVFSKIIDAESGECVESYIDLPLSVTPQAMGSAITYYRRYTLQSLLSLQAVDDDGQAASQPTQKETLTDERFENALRLIAEGKYTVEKLKAVYNLTPNQLTKL
jgi:hypothetical protein